MGPTWDPPYVVKVQYTPREWNIFPRDLCNIQLAEVQLRNCMFSSFYYASCNFFYFDWFGTPRLKITIWIND